MAVEKITLRLVGVGPMLMHSSRLADPLDPQAKALSKVTSKRNKVEPPRPKPATLPRVSWPLLALRCRQPSRNMTRLRARW